MKEKKQRNLVAKHARTFNKSAKFVDRKKRKNKGYRKHKGEYKAPLCYFASLCIRIMI